MSPLGPPHPTTVPARVLYIDDDPGFGALVKKRLERRGHTVFLAVGGAAGIERLSQGDIDVIALDHTMAGETGLDVMARLTTLKDHPPVVYVTGSNDPRVAVSALKSGADDYVIKDVSGEFHELLIAAIDQAMERQRLRRQREEDERAVREARDRAELLLSEVNHRIANSLGLVAAMVRMQAAALTDEACVKALRETQARISAIAGVHQRLYISERVGVVEADDYLSHLTREIEASMRDDAHPHTIALNATPVALSTDRAVSLGVIVSELATNAFKYAYPPGHAGEIRVDVRVTEDAEGGAGRRVTVAVEDDGAGFDPDHPSKGTGLGTKILSAMAINLKAAIERDPSHAGTRVTITFPLEDARAHGGG